MAVLRYTRLEVSLGSPSAAVEQGDRHRGFSTLGNVPRPTHQRPRPQRLAAVDVPRLLLPHDPFARGAGLERRAPARRSRGTPKRQTRTRGGAGQPRRNSAAAYRRPASLPLPVSRRAIRSPGPVAGASSPPWRGMRPRFNRTVCRVKSSQSKRIARISDGRPNRRGTRRRRGRSTRREPPPGTTSPQPP